MDLRRPKRYRRRSRGSKLLYHAAINIVSLWLHDPVPRLRGLLTPIELGLQISDISLADYISTKRGAVYQPHTAGRYQKKRFRKAQCPIVERCVPASLEWSNALARSPSSVASLLRV